MSEKNAETSYRSIAKGTAIFGGTQIVSMLSNLAKGKLSAHIIGAYGMGISSHLMSTLMPIQGFFTFGLNTSAVQTLSSITDEVERSHYVKSFRRLMLVLALMAMISTMASSWWLSQLTFHTPVHWDWFVLLAVAIFFLILASAETTILQSYRKLRELAFCNLVSPLAGLFVTVPCYWFWTYEGIAPSIAAVGLVAWCVARYFTQGIPIPSVQLSWKNTWQQSRGMLTLGASIMTSSVLGSLSTYLINTYIGNHGSESDIGLYQAAYNITLQSTGMVFAAMGTDFFPHLSSLVHQRRQAQNLVCQEGEIVMLLIVPIALLLITTAPLIIRILLTSEFDSTIFLLRSMSVCLIARAVCFPLDYICIAKGDNTYFLLMEGIWANVKTVVLIVIGYTKGGLDGIGIALLVGAAIEIAVSIFFNWWRYKITYSTSFYQQGAILTTALLCCYAFSFIKSPLLAYSLMVLTTIFAVCYAYCEMDKRIGIRNLIQQKFHAPN